jgi:hypothetical protein
MASEVDISNLALGHLGDNATVASLEPPEGSAQAEHCARFYPIARDSLLEMHHWNFATKRVQLAALDNPWPQWQHAYAKPADCLNIISVIDPEAPDDYATITGYNPNRTPLLGSFVVPQRYVVETNEAGAGVILTNQEDAVLRYTAQVTDTTKFSPLFVMALTHHLASMLAGPILKGEAGQVEGKRQTQLMMGYLGKAASSDSNQRKVDAVHNVGWIQGR